MWVDYCHKTRIPKDPEKIPTRIQRPAFWTFQSTQVQDGHGSPGRGCREKIWLAKKMEKKSKEWNLGNWGLDRMDGWYKVGVMFLYPATFGDMYKVFFV